MVFLKNCTLDELEQYFTSRRIFAYGAGTYIDKFSERNPAICIEKFIYSFVDKEQIEKTIGERTISVISFEQLRKEIIQTDIIVITTSHFYAEIIEKMDVCSEFDDVEVYILPFVENNHKVSEPDWELYSYYRNEKEVIPRVIHYCWFGGSEIPEELQFYMESWKKYCPDYKIVCWSENNYDVTQNQYIYEAYKNKKWAFVSDYVRIDVVNKFGGIYLDTDVEILKPLDELLHFRGFIGFENAGLVATGLGFGSSGKSEILEEILSCYQKREFLNSDGEMDLTPCPIIETQVLEKFGLKKNNCMQEIGSGFMVFPTTFFGGINLGTRQMEKEEYSYSVHHYAGTWMQEKDEVLKKRKLVGEQLIQRIKNNEIGRKN